MNETTINVKDFILDDEPSVIEKTNKTTARRKTTIEWEIVLQDAVDAVVRRKTAKTSRLLVLLMSKGQFYIKDEVTDEVMALNATNLSAFTKGMQPTTFVPWSTAFCPGKKGLDDFIEILSDENFQWLARRGEHKVDYASIGYDDSSWKLEAKRERLQDGSRKSLKAICDEFEEAQTTLLDAQTNGKIVYLRTEDGFRDFKRYVDLFGIDRARTFVKAFIEARYVGAALPDEWKLRQIKDHCNYDFNRMVQYVFFDSVRQGYGVVGVRDRYYNNNVDRFVDEWVDTLNMQVRIYGKVRDKYPDNLSYVHQLLSFKSALHQMHVDEDLFREHSQRLSENIYQDNYYFIRPPFNKEDMIDEATQQANCLASYTEAYAENMTDIYFMREALNPEKSLVTVEVRDGKIRQAYQAMNQTPTDEQIEWLEKWANDHDIEMIDMRHQRPLCA